MKRLIVTFLSLSCAWSAAFTASVTGNWASTSTWGGSGPPGNGDTVTINDGITVTIPVSTSVTIGTSPANDSGTAAIATVSDTGSGILIVNGTLIFRGPLHQGRALWVVGPGAIVTHDSSLASVPSAAHYSWYIGPVSTSVGTCGAVYLTVNGSTGSHVTFNVASSSGFAGGLQANVGAQCSGQMYATFLDVDHWGGGTNISSWFMTHNIFSGTGASATCDDCTFSNSGTIFHYFVGGGDSGDVLSLARLRVIAPVGRGAMADIYGNGYDPTGFAMSSGGTNTTTLNGGYLEGSTYCYANADKQGPAITNTVMYDPTGNNPSVYLSGCSMTGWNNNLVWSKIASNGAPTGISGGTLSRTIMLRSGSTGNPHFVTIQARQNVVLDRWITDCFESGTYPGDAYQVEGQFTAYDVLVKNSLHLSAPDDFSCGSFVNITESNVTGLSVIVRNSTFNVSSSGNSNSGVGGEVGTGKASLFTAVKNNIGWSLTGTDSYFAVWGAASPAANMFAGADYNWTYGLHSTPYYGGNLTSSQFASPNPPGTHDSVINTRLAAKKRSFLSWGQALDGAVTTWGDVITHLKNKDAGFTISNAVDWIMAGATPLEPLVWCAGDDGESAGAVPFCKQGKALIGAVSLF